MATNLTNNVISKIEINGLKYHLKSVPFHATEAEWLVSDYTPKDGELIVYDADASTNYRRYKTGDGETLAKDLPYSIVTQTELAALRQEINNAGHLKREIVGALPEVGNPDVIYMVKTSLIANDNYDEWMYINGAWELIGNTRVDLTDYVTWDKLREESFVKQVSVGTGLKLLGTQ